MQENYYNVKRLWMEAGIDKLSRKFTIATDLKLYNILLGLMSHSQFFFLSINLLHKH